jgi:peptidoglycan/LPS O-acetylase OafA/YrhL
VYANLHQHTANRQRLDIQVLRGIAVLYVVIYHADLGFLKSGFLGVDIFFVISGYLITGMICKDLDAGQFDIGKFYWGRAKRLLPATYATLIIVTLFSISSLTNVEFVSFIKTLFGTVTFTSNIVLWQQSGYFDISVDLKALLHMWSLSVEEQYYFMLPLLFSITPFPNRPKIVFIILVASALLCLVLVTVRPAASFYLLPTRAWELLIGSFGAICRKADFFTKAEHLGLLSIAVIILLPVIQIDPLHPRFDALAMCLATLIALWTRPKILQANILAALIGKVGDISFSLYLVHWPLFAFARNIYLGELPPGLKVGIATMSVPVAAALYRFVEKPIHRSGIRPTRWTIGAAFLTAIAILAIPSIRLVATTSQQNWTEIRKINYGFDEKCEYTLPFAPARECQSSDHPQIAVWGDSFAMHLVPGMKATDPGFGIIQVTRSSCGPFLMLAPFSKNQSPEECLEFNDSVRAFLAATPSVQYLVLSSPFESYVDGGKVLLSTGQEETSSLALATTYLGNTVSVVRSMRKKVVIVAPPPSAGFNIGLCTERVQTGLWTWPPNCSISTKTYYEKNQKVIKLLRDTSRIYDVPVIWLSDYLCDAKNCKVSSNGIPIYRDESHMSLLGSEELFKNFHLFKKIVDAAK